MELNKIELDGMLLEPLLHGIFIDLLVQLDLDVDVGDLRDIGDLQSWGNCIGGYRNAQNQHQSHQNCNDLLHDNSSSVMGGARDIYVPSK